jgi:hypothetical protein
MQNIVKNKWKKQRGQRMSYASAQNEMHRNGWEINHPYAVALYSYLGKENFMRLMENAEMTTNEIVNYLEDKTKEKIRGTSLYRELGCLTKANQYLLKMIEIHKLRETTNANSPLDFPVKQPDEEEIQREVLRYFVNKSAKETIAECKRAIRDFEGKGAEFGAVPYQFASPTKAEIQEFEQLLEEGNKLLEDKVEVNG